MGMDVYGRDPRCDAGKYFRNNVWNWRPLWDYCLAEHPEIAGKVVNGHVNDGDGLDDEDALALANSILADIRSGRVIEYEEEYQRKIDDLGYQTCPECNGLGDDGEEKCLSCMGSGKVLPFEAYYRFSMENVIRFWRFLECSGGFSIH